MTTDTVLVGDVGGTNVRFALATRNEGGIALERFTKLPGDDFGDFTEAVAAFLERSPSTPTKAMFALAGPCTGGETRLTNRDWPAISATHLEAQHGFRRARLVNDFAAMARGIPELSESDFHDLRPGLPAMASPILVTGPGTGLGLASIVRESSGAWRVLEGEGGHAAYAPRTAREVALADRLRAEFGYVSNELIVSGKSFPLVHRALCEVHGVDYQERSAQSVIDAALAGDPVCLDVCEIRAAAILGAAGDAAMIMGARGGVVLGGGVTRRLEPFLRAPEALARFSERGPQSGYLADTPIKMMDSEETPLLGAAALFFEGETDA
ncbi:MAG: glucokinase [Pseudomonadota bacterium]